MFCVFFDSASEALRGLSMPMKIVVKFAARSSASSSSSCATLSDASVWKLDRIVILAPEARELAQQLLRELLVPDEVVVDDEDLPRAEAMALADLRMTCSTLLVRGRRP